MLAGTANALHFVAPSVLAARGAVWTTNFDEFIGSAGEEARVPLHWLARDDEPPWAQPQGACGGQPEISREAMED